ncbi:MAG: MFS transporter, OFA family, oxalate/formate antiporter [Syntrophus sp. SKADARSKE-3]|nr:MFS transporter, OFA family, oxalate/formate antiporter [Syntrophus sp. SKADARSKE-3]MDQ5987692.1 MFS transporter, OFA family, oxalate/formate antiporter [Syntrophus sp. SKADARSKE-3]
MAEEKTFNRWLVVVGALLIQVSLGAVYIYSVFKPGLGLIFPTWSATDLALPSQLILAFFATGVIFAGRIQDKIGPRIVATVGGILLGSGLVMASFATNLLMFTLAFSVVGGIGIGTAYVCPIATCVKWFPDKRGMITGLAVAGFGAGALVFTPIAKAFIASSGIMSTFMYLGLIFLVAVVAGAQLMIVPPAGFKPAGWNPPAPAPGAAAAASGDFTTMEMLKTPQFYFLWLSYFAGCTAGLMIIMNITNMWQSPSMLELVKGMPTISLDAFKTVANQGALAVMIVAIFNAAGRLVWGQVSDVIGRKTTLYILFAVSGVIMLVLKMLVSFPLFLFGACTIGFCFGGFLGLYPAVTADYFGTKNVGANYGLMFAAFGAGGLFGPWLAPKLMTIVGKIPYEAMDKGAMTVKQFSAGDYSTSFIISGIMCLASIGIVWMLKTPQKS